jgi:hypothetical protein
MPPPPGSVIAQARPGEVRLRWQPADGAFCYEVRRGASASGPFSDIPCGEYAAAVTCGTAWIDPDVNNGTAYHYVLRSKAEDGTASTWTTPVSATPTWPQWQERGSGAAIRDMLNATASGGVCSLPANSIYRILGDGDFPHIQKSLTLTTDAPGTVEITASRNWAPGGEFNVSWTPGGTYWTSSAQTERLDAHEETGHATNNAFLAHTYLQVVGYTSTGWATEFIRAADGSNPGPGQWCYVSGSDLRLRLGNDPNGFKRLEVGTNAHRFIITEATNVTIQNLRFCHIGGGTSDTATGANDKSGYRFLDNTVGFVHSTGIANGSVNGDLDNVLVARNYVHHCCYMWSSTYNTRNNIVWESNRTDSCGYNWYYRDWADGQKFVVMRGAQGQFHVRFNEVGRGHKSASIWYDENADNDWTHHNRLQGNHDMYHFEISGGGLAEQNAMVSFPPNRGGTTGAEVAYMSNCQNHLMRRNLIVSRSGHGLSMCSWQPREIGQGNKSENNLIVMQGTQTFAFNHANNTGNSPGTSSGDRFYFEGGAAQRWKIDNQECSTLQQFNSSANVLTDGVMASADEAQAALKLWGVVAGEPVPPVPVKAPVRVNLGGAEYTDKQALRWSADPGASAGSATPLDRPGLAIAGTEDDPLFASEVWGPDFTYAWALPDADYTLRLGFCEMYCTGVGQRVFDVYVNGTKALSSFDIFAVAGAQNTAVSRQLEATATAGKGVAVRLVGTTQNAQITAIEIVATSDVPPGPEPEPPIDETFVSTFIWIPREAECPHGRGATSVEAIGVRIACPSGKDCWYLRTEALQV